MLKGFRVNANHWILEWTYLINCCVLHLYKAIEIAGTIDFNAGKQKDDLSGELAILNSNVSLKLHLYIILVFEWKLQKRSSIYSLFESRYHVIGGIIFNNSSISPWKAPQTQWISNQNQELWVLDMHPCVYVSVTLTDTSEAEKVQ